MRARYVEQAASDLEENRRLQQELTERIAVLKQEEALLSDILNLAERYQGFADVPRLPEQAQDEPVAAKAKPALPRTASRRSPTARTSSARTAAKKGAKAKGKTRQPLLGDLLADLLAQYDEPRLAKDLRDELLVKHPDRNPTPQVVRNTLESLVAKGRIRRQKKEGSVMYTLVKADDREDAAPAGDAG
nr:hypothetical protein [Streptomyces harenosi]